MIVAYFLLLSSLALTINTQAQDCSKPVGGENMGLKDGDILLQTFPHGIKVSFACDTGYITKGGSSSITCTDGSWSRVNLKCEIKSCGNAGNVDNGYIDYPEGSDFGAKLVVICNTGHRLVGRSPNIICGVAGWTGRLPECEVVTCSPLKQVVAGTFSPIQDFYDYRQVVEFTCNDDHTLNGSKSISCSADGTFKPAPPTCVTVLCKDPVIENAVWVGGSRPPHRHMATVNYKCVSGHTMKGAGTQTCGIDGQWSPGLPTCEPVLCKDPVIENAVWVGGSRPPHRHMATVTYKCVSGHTMKGAGTQTCGIDGQWSPGLPTCESVLCKDPVIENAAWDGGSQPPHRHMATVTYKCVSGHTMKGAGTQTCGVDGRWSPGLPTCEPVLCKDPVIENAAWDGGSRPPHRHMATVTYKCVSGHTMTGEGTQTCGVDGRWSPGLPTCQPVQCKDPDIENAAWDGGSRSPYNYMSTVTYECVSGYNMKGERTLACGVDGQWSPGLPTCEHNNGNLVKVLGIVFAVSALLVPHCLL
ncbi:C4b-binding protein alpha chain-like isoform 4-T4 [Lycodopsis pacificus]